ncbi:MAG: HNH endonuclease [Deltaproteobacteria bacterium]
MRTTGVAVVERASEWVVAHEALSRLAQERAAADAEEGRWLLAAARSAAHVHLGFGSFGEYVERMFGYKPRSTQEKLRVAEALEQLPRMAQALEQGALHWSAVRELTRVAVAETEREWLEVARGKSVRQLEELVAGKCPGDDPSSPHQPAARRHVLRFEVAPETFALFREALTALRRSTASSLDDDATLLAMARHVLGGPRDDGRASYQIALSVCQECGRGQQSASGELVPVGTEIVAMAECDGQHIGYVTPRCANDGSPLGAALANDNAHVDADAPTNDNARVGAVAPSEGARCIEPVVANVGGNAHVDAHTHDPQGPGGTSKRNAVRHRAKQAIPPALRRRVLLRDHRRCRVPGCRNSQFLDLHHVELRSEGGPNEPENLLTLCGVHHRAAHRGVLLIEHSAAQGIRYRHADGRAYGEAVRPRALEAQTKTYSALRTLGFREAEVRAVLEKLRGQGDLRDASTEQLLRAALACLTRPRSAR